MSIRSKLDYWCEGVLEAGWLAAVTLSPLFFNVFSSRVFEPDKISLMRSIALVMIMAWLTKLANGGPAWLPAYGSVERADARGLRLDWRQLMRLPFFIPVILLILAYLIGTAFSVAPFVSWFGSYQRLQGTFSFLSYVTIAGLAAAHLRRPEQIRRLRHAIIAASFPIALYGIVQHNNIDPLPWGGDVVTRVAANAGNAIFLGAYLILAFFLTLERVYASFAAILNADPEGSNTSVDIASALSGSIYVVIIVAQLIALVWTQSRGPWIGWAVGLYLFVLLLFSARRPRNYLLWTGAWVGLGVTGFAALILLNTLLVPTPLCSASYVGRLCRLLETEGTGKVRILIWSGVAEMMKPHEALTYPDGSKDRVNPLRQIIGYGPETMWVAYNRFYQPELANVELRNASPDRSHNETWDSLVITGAFGFIGYMALFVSIFYWVLKWLGLLVNRRDQLLLYGLMLAGFVVWMTLLYIFDDGRWRFFGVALPVGMISGLVVYTTVAAFIHSEYRPERADIPRVLMIITLFSAIVAHFAEIHFGIAIAATRTHFWLLTALLLTLGMRWAQPDALKLAATSGEATDAGEATKPAEPVVPSPQANTQTTAQAAKNRKGRPQPTTARPRSEAPRRASSVLPILPSTIMTDVLIFLTAVFIYTTNPQQQSQSANILFDSISKLVRNGVVQNSPTLLFLLMFTWLFAVSLGMCNEIILQRRPASLGWWLRGYALHALIVGGAWLVYGLFQAGRVAPIAIPEEFRVNLVDQLNYQLNFVADHFAYFTWLALLWIAAAGTVYAWSSLNDRRFAAVRQPVIAIIAAPVLAVGMFFLVSSVNIDLVRADIIYKQGQQFDASGQWLNSVELYKRALAERSTEDQYMLFLGRALLELAKTIPNLEGAAKFPEDGNLNTVLNLQPTQVQQMGRLDLLRAAEKVLIQAQRVNPLNTDHTANLSRLYRTWGDLTTELPETRQQMLEKSAAMYDKAIMLSPNAAHLWNERGNALQALGKNEEAETSYLHSLAIDPIYEQTYLLLGDYYDRSGQFDKMAEVMQKGLDSYQAVGRGVLAAPILSYLGVAYARTNQITQSIATNLKVVELQPDNVAAIRNLALLYQNQGAYTDAVQYIDQAIAVVGPAGGQVYTDLLTTGVQIYQQLTGQDAGNYNALAGMARLLQQLGQTDNARQLAQQALQLAPEADKAPIQQLVQSLGG
jgi:tetratricopeptide (TPR) repeat protein